MGYVEWNSIGAIAEAQLKSKNTAGALPSPTSPAGILNAKTKGSNEGLTYPAAEQLTQSAAGIVTAPASGCTNLRANAYGVGNSLAHSDISQFPVARAAAGIACKAAYVADTGGLPSFPTVNTVSGQINAAGGRVPATGADTYCIGPSVGYLTPYYIGPWASEPAVTSPLGAAASWTGYSYVYQYLRPPIAGAGYNGDIESVRSQGPNPNTIAEYSFRVLGLRSGPNWKGLDGNMDYGARQFFAYDTSELTVTNPIKPRNWARLATFGEQVQFGPIQAGPNGKNMGGEDSLACTDGGSSSGGDNPSSAKTGNKAAKNGSGEQIKLAPGGGVELGEEVGSPGAQLEGLAYFQVIAGQMSQAKPANIPKDSSGNDLVGSKTHENCAANLQAMFTFNTNAIVENSNSPVVPAAGTVKGNQPNAISFPTWKVAIGTKPLAQDFNYFVVPNGFCYANQCLQSYLTSVTQNKGADFGKLIKEPNMGAPSTGKTCGLANGACATLDAYRLDNITPLTYQCSTVSGAGGGIPAACGTTRWTSDVAPTFADEYANIPTAPTGTQYINTQTETTISRSAWNGQEWPAPLVTTKNFGNQGRINQIGAPVI
jgi:hypothetical protein